MPRNLTLEPKYVEALNRWQLYISPMLSSTGKPQRLFYRTKRAAETAAGVFERRQKNFGSNLSELTPAHMAIAAEAFELLGDRDDVALLEIVRAGLAHENAKTASVPFGNLFDEFLAEYGNSPNCATSARRSRGAGFIREPFPQSKFKALS